MKLQPNDLEPLDLAERHNSGARAVFLERAEYVSKDYARRLVVDFDWQRAAARLPPWQSRRYVARPHATSPNGIAWRLVARRSYFATLSGLHQAARAWMAGAD